ncbi:glycosyltransferase family 4 protein [Candidatus Bipolaricaulota bacterium]
MLAQDNRIVHLTTGHQASDTRIFHKQINALVKAGYNVTLIAQNDANAASPGVRIIALASPKNRTSRFVGLAIRALRLAIHQHADVYHFHDPELLGIVLPLKLLTRGKIIYDVHENVRQQILGKLWIPKLLRRSISLAFGIFEKIVSIFCDAVVPATENIAEVMPHRHSMVIHNYPDLGMFRAEGERMHGGDKHLLYVGGISHSRGILEMIAALEQNATNGSPVRLELIGRFSSRELDAKVQCLPGYKYVDYQGVLPWDEAWEHANNAIAGLVLFHPGPNHTESLPNKLFEYMAMGLPVIASNFPLWRRIVEDNHCGLTVNPLDPDDIVRAIRYVTTHPEEATAMGFNGRHAVEKLYNWEAESTKLLQLYERILS